MKVIIKIANINLDGGKHVNIALRGIYGIGLSTANLLCKKLKIECSRKLMSLSDDEIESIREAIKPMPHEGGLRKKVSSDIERLIRTKSYRGKRIKYGLPARGQRTSSNASTASKRVNTAILNK